MKVMQDLHLYKTLIVTFSPFRVSGPKQHAQNLSLKVLRTPGLKSWNHAQGQQEQHLEQQKQWVPSVVQMLEALEPNHDFVIFGLKQLQGGG